MDLREQYEAISVFKTASPARLIWSLSPISAEGSQCMVRVAGEETETGKKWLGESLKNLQDVIGVDVYRRAFA